MELCGSSFIGFTVSFGRAHSTSSVNARVIWSQEKREVSTICDDDVIVLTLHFRTKGAFAHALRHFVTYSLPVLPFP